jgi:hypothetical protein
MEERISERDSSGIGMDSGRGTGSGSSISTFVWEDIEDELSS